MALRLFGLTGGIGSGKSAVARRFVARGLPVLDADQLAREVVARGTPGLEEIIARFGTDVLEPGGELDRKKLAARVFNAEDERRALNRITHPRIGELLSRRSSELENGGEPLACYEVPLLYEAGLETALAPVVVVDAPVALRIERTVVRDGCTADEARARVNAQMPLEEKVRRADYVIDNTGLLSATLSRADEILDAVCVRLGIDPTRYPRA